MSVTYTATTPDGREVRYRDRKRWAWMLSMLWPLMPFVGLAAHHATGIEAALALPLLISYGLMPLLSLIHIWASCCSPSASRSRPATRPRSRRAS